MISFSSSPAPTRPLHVAPGVPGRRASFVPPRARRSRSPRRERRRRLVLSAVIATGVTAVVIGAMSSFAGVAGPSVAPLPPFIPPVLGEHFSPTADDGFIADGERVSLGDDDLPAIARLDPDLRAALRLAERDAADDGIRFGVTSGWRSFAYQQWLLDTRIAADGESVARAYVATPDQSRHVSGDAVDIGPVDAQYWLISSGWEYGICQTYGNEPWHFELATEPGGDCPPMRTDASG
ncbi:MAG: M15 family metallopeptidase [Microbacterium arborescens]